MSDEEDTAASAADEYDRWLDVEWNTGKWTVRSLDAAVDEDLRGGNRILPGDLRERLLKHSIQIGGKLVPPFKQNYSQLHRRRGTLLGVTFHNVDRQTTSAVRRRMEGKAFEEIARQPRERQVEALAALWSRADELDALSRPVRRAITEWEKTGMPREDVWRMLQALADSYREGEPLCMKDRVTLLAETYLDPDIERRRALMADALFETDSGAKSMRKAVKEMVSKAEEASAKPLPASTRPPDVRDRFPLLMELAASLGVRVEIRRSDGTTIAVAGVQQPLPDSSNH